MIGLVRRPPLMPDETLLSHVSRTARCYGTDMSVMCHELGLSRRGLAVGGADDVSRYAELTGLSPSVLSHRAFRRDRGIWWNGGQALHRHGVRRLVLTVCPRCLRDDAATSRLRPDRAAYVRAHWLVKAVRTCDKHHVELSTLIEPEVPKGLGIHDVAQRLEPSLGDLDRLAAGSRERTPTCLERYVIERLRGGPVHCGYVDQMPLFAAARTCEMLGAVALFGPGTSLRTLDADAWRAAGAVGFDVASIGAEAVRSCLADMAGEHTSARPDAAGRKFFGVLYDWLTRDPGPHYEPLSAIMREIIFDRVPIAAGTEVLGVVLEQRRFHSLYSAMVETGRGWKGLRREFRAAGVLPIMDGKGPKHPVAIPVDRTIQAMEDLSNSLSRAKAAAHLGATGKTIKRLAEAGLISPVTPRIKAGDHVRFSARALDAFLDRLMQGVTGVVPQGADMRDIATAGHRTTRKLAAIASMVMEGRLRHVSRRPEVKGFHSILVDIDEILAVPEAEAEVGYTLDEAAAELRVNRPTVLSLIRTGHLRTRKVPARTSERMVTLVERASLDDFRSDHMSLAELAGYLGVCWRAAQIRLEAAGVSPVFPRSRTQSIILRRREAIENARPQADESNGPMAVTSIA